MNQPHTIHAKRPHMRANNQGMALLEALVASAVLGIGLAGAIRLSLHALQTATDTRQHMVATMLATEAMDCLQSGRSWCEMNQQTTVQGTPYILSSQLRPRPGLALEDIEVHVHWPIQGKALASEQGEQAAGAGHNRGQLSLHSSRDQVPAWLGVSSP
jgi:type II secretory pathway pseudopilin PulG